MKSPTKTDHFLMDLAFLGVLTAPFFSVAFTLLSQTWQTQRPVEIYELHINFKSLLSFLMSMTIMNHAYLHVPVGMESIPTQKVWYPRSHLSQNIISSSWWGCWHTVQVLHSIHCQLYVWMTDTSSPLMSKQDGWPKVYRNYFTWLTDWLLCIRFKIKFWSNPKAVFYFIQI